MEKKAQVGGNNLLGGNEKEEMKSGVKRASRRGIACLRCDGGCVRIRHTGVAESFGTTSASACSGSSLWRSI